MQEVDTPVGNYDDYVHTIYIYIIHISYIILCDFLCSSFADIVLKIFNNHNHQQSWVLSGLQPFSIDLGAAAHLGKRTLIPSPSPGQQTTVSLENTPHDMGPALICPDRQHKCAESMNPIISHSISMKSQVNPH